ncbi:MAG: hypothetical protein IJC77_02960 [Bacteroidaceae bacterium]|nr:hypothetical protein [Bacteroidaceae bacterium]
MDTLDEEKKKIIENLISVCETDDINERTKKLDDCKIAIEVYSKRVKQHIEFYNKVGSIEIAAFITDKVKNVNGYKAFCFYNEILSMILKVSKEINLDNDLSKFQSNQFGIIKMANFYANHEIAYCLDELCRYIYMNTSEYDYILNKLKDYKTLIHYLSIKNTEQYKSLAPIIMYYTGGFLQTYHLIDNLDDYELNLQLHYYYLRSAKDINISLFEIDSIINSGIRFIDDCKNNNSSKFDTYYCIQNLIESGKEELIDQYIDEQLIADNIEFPKIKEELLIDLEQNSVNTFQLNSFLQYAEKYHNQNKNVIPNIWLWDYFYISSNNRMSMYREIVENEIVSVEKYLGDTSETSKQICLNMPGDVSPLHINVDDDSNIEIELVSLLKTNTPESIILLSYYYYLKGLKRTDKMHLSTTSLITIIMYCAHLQDTNSGRQSLLEKLKKISPSVIATSSFTIIGCLNNEYQDITTMLCALIPICRELLSSGSAKDSMTYNYLTDSTMTYLDFSSLMISKFAKDKNEFGSDFYKYYPAFSCFKQIRDSVLNDPIPG